jgi:hypothetical protein
MMILTTLGSIRKPSPHNIYFTLVNAYYSWSADRGADSDVCVRELRRSYSLLPECGVTRLCDATCVSLLCQRLSAAAQRCALKRIS